jgi:SAM-dependent methyltransferase
MPCERIAFPAESFDIVVGTYILHHVEVGACIREVHRVLKTGGQAFFLEWIEWPPFEWLRTSRLFLHFFPREASLERHITQDERKLNQSDLQEIESVFGRLQALRFHSLTRVGRIIPSLKTPAMKLDFKIYRLFPAFRRTGGSVIIFCRKTS